MGRDASPEAFDVVHAHILRFFPDLVRELGADPDALRRRAGIAPQRPGHPEPDVTYRQMVELMELAAAQLDCPDFGLRLAARQGSAEVFGPLGAVMINSRTFGEALEYVSTHSYAHSLAARVWLRRLPAEGVTFSGHDILLDRIESKVQTIEQVMLLGHLAAMEMTGGYARARRVHFRHQPASPLRTYRRHFGCDVFFGQSEDGVFFSDRDMAAPIVDRDAQAYRDAVAHIDAEFDRHRPPLHAEVRGLVMQFLRTQRCTNEGIATELGMHPRTLHRRLRGEGTSFHRIKDEVRRDLALYYFQRTDMDFARISEMLGFAEQSVLSRRCNLWFSAPPSRVRSPAPTH